MSALGSSAGNPANAPRRAAITEMWMACAKMLGNAIGMVTKDKGVLKVGMVCLD